MKTYTKEQIIEEIEKSGAGKIMLGLIENIFNNLEKPNFERWRWYSHSAGAFMLYNPNCGDCQVGFTTSGRFSDCIGPFGNEWQPATQEQIEPLLRAEAERRGFIEEGKFNSVPEFEGCYKYSNRLKQSTIKGKIYYYFKEDILTTDFGVLYEKGRWAKLVEEKSLEDRVKDLESIVQQLNKKQ